MVRAGRGGLFEVSEVGEAFGEDGLFAFVVDLRLVGLVVAGWPRLFQPGELESPNLIAPASHL